MNILNNDDIPVGLSMAFAENLRAMEQFANLSEEDRMQVIDKARHAASKQEMRGIVQGISEWNGKNLDVSR